MNLRRSPAPSPPSNRVRSPPNTRPPRPAVARTAGRHTAREKRPGTYRRPGMLTAHQSRGDSIRRGTVTDLASGIATPAIGFATCRDATGMLTAGTNRFPGSRTRPPYRASQSPRGRSGIEITGLASDIRHTPAAQILIERGGVAEHVAHVRDIADVPRPDVLIERRGPAEHSLHAQTV